MARHLYCHCDGFENLFYALRTKRFGKKKVLFIVPKNVKEGLLFIKDLVQKKKFRPLIDRTYSLDQIAQAFQYVATGQKIGNVIIRIA